MEVFDGVGGLADAEIISADSRRVSVKIKEINREKHPKQGQIIIASSVAKGERFDWLISKCTELGVDRICPLICHHTVKQPGNPKIVERYENLAVAAAKQCQRLFLPQIDFPADLENVIAEITTRPGETMLLTGSLGNEAEPLAELKFNPQANIAAFIGPEAGFTEQEEQSLIQHGAKPVRLGRNILRTETAAESFAAILEAKRLAQN